MQTIRIRSRVMKRQRIKLLLLASAWIASASHAEAIFIESLESKTLDQKAVFNRIDWQSEKDRDVWMMQQSHHGPTPNEKEWDRLAIVIDKKVSPYQAHFYQLAPGPLKLEAAFKEVPFRVSCFVCHSNGPRAIRPEVHSKEAPLSMAARMKILLWNIRIKTYPRIEVLSAPGFRFTGKSANAKLEIKTCIRCHQDSGLIARGYLTRQNAATIHFMIEQKEMPPFPFSLSQKEKLKINAFLDGL